MGHEFVELKNSHAAIEAYRKAIGRCHLSEWDQEDPPADPIQMSTPKTIGRGTG